MTESRAAAPEPAENPVGTARRIVVKVGSSSLTTAAGGLDVDRLRRLVDVLSRRRAAGQEVLLVSSGAIAAGLSPLGLVRRPSDLASQQAAASVGQGLLAAHYAEAFANYRIVTSQVLLTPEDLMRRTFYLNAQRALERLIGLGVLPVVNENDTVATHEIRFGDNDRLAALVAHLVHADALLLLSDVDAVYDAPPSTGHAHRIREVRSPADLAGISVHDRHTSGIGTGGMATKVHAATIAASSGVTTLVTSAVQAAEAFAGADVGTLFHPTGVRRPTRLLWLANLAPVRGGLVLDAGAVHAVTAGHKSLLAAGVTAVRGTFEAGDAVELLDPDGRTVGRGLVNYASDELPKMLGHTTRELVANYGPAFDREVVHRDDLVVMAGRAGARADGMHGNRGAAVRRAADGGE